MYATKETKVIEWAIAVLLCSIFTQTKAQTTIGSAYAPVQGAILDLKQEEKTDGSANSTKGLGLPPVGLLHLTIPEGEISLATTIDKASGEWDANDHIGLVIYNVNPGYNGSSKVCPVDKYYPNMDGIKKGPYVWDGNKWQYLIAVSYNPIPEVDDVLIMTDERDGEKYAYRAFGDPADPENFAGYWTLENARYKDSSMTFGFPSNRTDTTYIYPNGGSDGNPPITWRPNQGLLYSYSAATLGGQDDYWTSEDQPAQGQESGDVENTPIMQGVCPAGWHVPTDREWNKLAKVIYNNPTEYSEYTSRFATPWEESWETAEDFQGTVDDNNGLGIAMLATCTPLFINENSGETDRTTSAGKSKTSLAGGFNALDLGTDGDTYRQAAGFWTSSFIGEGNESIWGRAITTDYPQGLLRSLASFDYLMSVRCKKD